MGALILKRRADAERDGDRIYAVIREVLGAALADAVPGGARGGHRRADPGSPGPLSSGAAAGLARRPAVDPRRRRRASMRSGQRPWPCWRSTPPPPTPRPCPTPATPARCSAGTPRRSCSRPRIERPWPIGHAISSPGWRITRARRSRTSPTRSTAPTSMPPAASGWAWWPRRRPTWPAGCPRFCRGWMTPHVVRSATAAAPIIGTSPWASRVVWRSCSPARGRSTRGCSPTCASTSPRCDGQFDTADRIALEQGDVVPPSAHLFGDAEDDDGPVVGADGGQPHPQRAMGAVPGADAAGPAAGRRRRPQQRRDPGPGGRGRAAGRPGAGAPARTARGHLPGPGIGRRHAGGPTGRRRRRSQPRRGGVPGRGGGRCHRRHRQLPAPGRPGRPDRRRSTGWSPICEPRTSSSKSCRSTGPTTLRISPPCSGRSPSRSPG